MVEVLILISQMFVRWNVGYFVEVLVLIREVKIHGFIIILEVVFIFLVSIKSAAICPEVGLFWTTSLRQSIRSGDVVASCSSCFVCLFVYCFSI